MRIIMVLLLVFSYIFAPPEIVVAQEEKQDVQVFFEDTSLTQKEKTELRALTMRLLGDATPLIGKSIKKVIFYQRVDEACGYYDYEFDALEILLNHIECYAPEDVLLHEMGHAVIRQYSLTPYPPVVLEKQWSDRLHEKIAEMYKWYRKDTRRFVLKALRKQLLFGTHTYTRNEIALLVSRVMDYAGYVTVFSHGVSYTVLRDEFVRWLDCAEKNICTIDDMFLNMLIENE